MSQERGLFPVLHTHPVLDEAGQRLPGTGIQSPLWYLAMYTFWHAHTWLGCFSDCDMVTITCGCDMVTITCGCDMVTITFGCDMVTITFGCDMLTITFDYFWL